MAANWEGAVSSAFACRPRGLIEWRREAVAGPPERKAKARRVGVGGAGRNEGPRSGRGNAKGRQRRLGDGWALLAHLLLEREDLELELGLKLGVLGLMGRRVRYRGNHGEKEKNEGSEGETTHLDALEAVDAIPDRRRE